MYWNFTYSQLACVYPRWIVTLDVLKSGYAGCDWFMATVE